MSLSCWRTNVDREIVMQLAAQAGFGGNNRNTFGPKLIKFASLIEKKMNSAPIWPRADPEALARFDPSTKVCVMNCGQSLLDPRTKEECKFLCDDCETVATKSNGEA